jgi:hypothetical protein
MAAVVVVVVVVIVVACCCFVAIDGGADGDWPRLLDGLGNERERVDGLSSHDVISATEFRCDQSKPAPQDRHLP